MENFFKNVCPIKDVIFRFGVSCKDRPQRLLVSCLMKEADRFHGPTAGPKLCNGACFALGAKGQRQIM
jgi:hypothetical protein